MYFVNNDHEQNLTFLYTFFPDKSFGLLLEMSQTNFIFLNKFYLNLFYVKVWFTDQSSKPPLTEDKKNITLLINWHVRYKMRHSLKPRDWMSFNNTGLATGT